MRPAVVLGTNLALAGAALAWVLWRHGAAALELLVAEPSGAGLAAWLAAMALGFLVFAWRWAVVLDGLGARVGLGPLTAWRAAGHSVSALVPSARLGGEPLRAWLAVQRRVPPPIAIASVAVDRTLEMGAGAAFAAVFGTTLVQQGVPELRGAVITIAAAALGLIAGLAVMARRLRRGQGLLTALASGTRLDRFALVRDRLAAVATAERALAAAVEQRARLAAGFGIGVLANVVVMIEYWLLLVAFGLPAGPVAVIAALFATAAAHSMPVPAAIGVLEGGQMWLFSMLGHSAEVGLAVGLAVRLREVCCALPGLLYLGLRLAPTPSRREAGAADHGRRPQKAAPRNPG